MLASTILYMFVSIIVLFILIEYLNNRRYQSKKQEERKKSTSKKPTEPIQEVIKDEKVASQEPELPLKKIPEVVAEVKHETIVEIEPEEAPETQIEAVEEIPEQQLETTKESELEEVIEEAKVLPECTYPPFTHVRLVEMGLSDEEATEFVNELIPQLEEQIPLIEKAINSADFNQIEQLTHGIKGSASNLGTGGISDLLVEFNTYVKSGTDTDIIKAYHANFLHYIDELKKQYA